MLAVEPGVLDAVLEQPTSRTDLLAELSAAAERLREVEASLPAGVPRGYALNRVVRAVDDTAVAPALGCRLVHGFLPAIELSDRTVALVQSFAVDALPALIADADADDARSRYDDRWGRGQYTPSVRFGSSVAEAATEALAADPLLSPLTAGDPEDPHRGVFIHYGNGNGSGIQMSLLLERLLDVAWCRMNSDSPSELLAEVRRAVDDARKVAQGQPVEARTYLGLLGVSVDEPLELPWGVLRPPRRADFDLGGPMDIPEVAAVLELRRPLTSSIGDAGNPAPGGRESQAWGAEQDLAVLKTALTLMLSLEDRDQPPALRVVASRTQLPVASGGSIGHSGASLYVRQTVLSKASDGARIAAWASIVDQRYCPAVGVAVRRAVRAVAEREDPEDALIDAVISLESLFSGKSSGDLAFRIGGSVAWLLHPEDATERDRVFAQIKNVYSRRSDVVHGRVAKVERTRKAHDDAIRLVIEALRCLFRDFPALIEVEDRSRTLLVGGRSATGSAGLAE